MLAKLLAIVEHDSELCSWLELVLQPATAKAFCDARCAIEYQRAADRGLSAPRVHDEHEQHNRTGMKSAVSSRNTAEKRKRQRELDVIKARAGA
jgi:hypothetical protein